MDMPKAIIRTASPEILNARLRINFCIRKPNPNIRGIPIARLNMGSTPRLVKMKYEK
jgi:hypothetical protein